MDCGNFTALAVTKKPGCLYVTLNRPEVSNAMNSAMVEELLVLFESIAEDRDIRAVVLRGAGGNFCAGGDVKGMARLDEVADGSKGDPALALNRLFGRMISTVNAAPQAVIAVLEGAVLGGGFGLACVSDVAIARHDARFGMPETSLGIPPAQIAPFVVQRIGLTQARRFAVMGARFNGEEAKELGLVHLVCHRDEELELQVRESVTQVFRCAPGANAVTKKLMLSVGTMPVEELLDRAAAEFCACIRGPEGREGTRAFVEKRKPTWMEV